MEEEGKHTVLDAGSWCRIKRHELMVDIEGQLDSAIVSKKQENSPHEQGQGMGGDEETVVIIDRKVQKKTIKAAGHVVSSPMTFHRMIAHKRLRGNYQQRAYTKDEIETAYYKPPPPPGITPRMRPRYEAVKGIFSNGEACTAKTIGKNTGISKSALERLLNIMIVNGELEYRDILTGGRPAREYRLCR